MTELGFEMPLGGGDTAEPAGRRGRLLRDVAGLWRHHVPDDDPLSAYARTLDHPAYERVLRGYLSGSLDLVFRVGEPVPRRGLQDDVAGRPRRAAARRGVRTVPAR